MPPRVTTSAMRVAALPKLASVRKQTPLSFLAARDVWNVARSIVRTFLTSKTCTFIPKT